MVNGLREFLAMVPGVVSGLSGDPGGAAAFMEGFQEGQQRADQEGRRNQLDAFAIEDRNAAQQERQRQITRQQTLDAQALEDRNRRQALEALQIPGTLAELGATAETPEDAQRLIEAAMPNLMKDFGQETMAYGMPAIEMATRTITGRQKAEVRRFLESVLESEHVAANPEADPELTAGLIPPRIQQLIGKQSARLSEIQRWADAPVGRPARKPSEDVSWQRDEMLVNGVPTVVFVNPKTREIKNQAGENVSASPIPPRAPSSIDGRSPAAVATFNQIASQYQRSPLTNAADRTIVLKDAAEAIRQDPFNAANQMALAYSYIQALDTYQSAVREGELQNLGALGTMYQQLLVKANQVATTGAFMPPEVAQQIAEASDRLVQTIEAGRAKKRAEFAARAKASGVGDLWAEFMAGIPGGPSTPPPQNLPSDALPPMAPVSSRGPTRTGNRPANTGAPKLRERRRFGDVLGEWDGEKWVEVKP